MHLHCRSQWTVVSCSRR